MEIILERIDFFIEKYPYLKTILYSLFLVVLFAFIGKVIKYKVEKKKKVSRAKKNFLKKKTDQYLKYILVIFVVFLWFSKLQVFFVSIIAIAAAIVIAFKELIMCFMGGLLCKLSSLFEEGDRIELDGHRGFVIEKNILTTKILEIGPEVNSQQTTGDVITLPNSLMLAKSVKNQSYFKGYSIKSFRYKISKFDNIRYFEDALLKKAEEISSECIDEAKKGISAFCEREGIIIPSIEPRTKIIIEAENIVILVKMPVKNSMIGEKEQEINRYFVELVLNQP